MFFLYLALALALLASLWIAALALTRSRRAEDHAQASLKSRRIELERRFAEFVSLRGARLPDSCAPPSEHPQAPSLFRSLRDAPARALPLAEEAMAADPSSPDARLLLATALLASADVVAANAQLRRAEELGATGPLADYLKVRLEIEAYLHSVASKDKPSDNSILMPVELLALTLRARLEETGEASALWMPGQGGEVSNEEAREFVMAHFSRYYRLLTLMLESLESREYGDGLYHLARLALKCGFAEPAGRLLMSLEVAMKESAAQRPYLRDLALLRGQRPVAAEAREGGKKVIKLRVLG